MIKTDYFEMAKEEIELKGYEGASLPQLLSSVLSSNDSQMLFELSNIGMRNLSKMTDIELLQIDGVDEKIARQILSICQIAKIYSKTNLTKGFKVRKVEDVFEIFEYLKFEEQENFSCIFLNSQNEILRKKTIFKGTLDTAVVHPREIFKEAVKLSAAGIICAHNHPSGNPEPSMEDNQLTRRLKECGELMGIGLIDHIIIGDKENYSYNMKNKLK